MNLYNLFQRDSLCQTQKTYKNCACVAMTVGQRKKEEGGRLEMASGKYTLSRKVTHSFTFDVLFGLTAVAFAATQCQHVGNTFKKIAFTPDPVATQNVCVFFTLAVAPSLFKLVTKLRYK